jgi:hypothetical protein
MVWSIDRCQLSLLSIARPSRKSLLVGAASAGGV